MRRRGINKERQREREKEVKRDIDEGFWPKDSAAGPTLIRFHDDTVNLSGLYVHGKTSCGRCVRIQENIEGLYDGLQ